MPILYDKDCYLTWGNTCTYLLHMTAPILSFLELKGQRHVIRDAHLSTVKSSINMIEIKYSQNI